MLGSLEFCTGRFALEEEPGSPIPGLRLQGLGFRVYVLELRVSGL